MAEVKAIQDVYFSQFSALEERRGAQEPTWLRTIRHSALDRFGELGFPTTKIEAWRFTNVSPIANTRFEPARRESGGAVKEQLKILPYADLGCHRVAFVNGRFSPELSSTAKLPRGVRAGSLAAAFATDGSLLEQHLARYAAFQDHAFVALNIAFLEDGAFIEISKGTILEEPIHLLFVSTGGAQPVVTHSRNLVLVGRESQVTFIETHVALDGGIYLTNAVTEVVAGDNSVVHYAKVQEESPRAYHMGSLHVQLARGTNATTYVVGFGATLSRQDLTVVFDGDGAEALLNGLYVIDSEQHLDNYTTLDHAKPHTSSREFYKGVLDGKSSGVFHGRIIVRKGAQKTDAKQSNKNLLLSDDAVINTKPQLEIYADDVKCTHGATIGQIDQDAVFYLRSRGIPREEARAMLTHAFASEVIGRIKYEPLRARLTETLSARLKRGQGIQEA